MEHSQFLFTLFCTVGFCLGLRIVTDKGQLLYCLRKPFEGLEDLIENKAEMLKYLVYENDYNWEKRRINIRRINILKLKYYLSKPVIMCITCLASVWGCVVFISINGINYSLISELLLNCVSASFIQTFIWKLYERL